MRTNTFGEMTLQRQATTATTPLRPSKANPAPILLAPEVEDLATPLLDPEDVPALLTEVEPVLAVDRLLDVLEEVPARDALAARELALLPSRLAKAPVLGARELPRAASE